MGKVKQKVISIISTIAVSTSLFVTPITTNAVIVDKNFSNESIYEEDKAVRDYGLGAKIDDGAILHAWNWSFNQVRENIEKIAECGYTSVQVSPIQTNKDTPMIGTSQWWKLYQPINFKIGNDLGTSADFKAMCDEAHKYGVKIVVDVVANHLGNETNGYDKSPQIPDNIRNNTNYWHNSSIGKANDSSRYQMTQGNIGMPDLNTGNTDIQNMVIAFLNEAQELGADGFRFDAAKHIELPTDSGCSSQFWPRITEAIKSKDSDAFIYGEILGTAGTAIENYTKYMRVTECSLGYDVREAIYNTNASKAQNYPQVGEAKYAVTWVESHDTYTNEKQETTDMTDEQIRLGWGLIGARKDSVPLFFVRPISMSASLGEFTTLWQNKEIVAINKFHNYFAGKSEYVRILNNNSVFAVERGNTGVAITNLGSGTATINTKTTLEDGTYTDQVSGNKFTVKNGTLNGTVAGKTIAVVYNPINGPKATISQEGGTFKSDTLELTLGLNDTASLGTYSINGGEEKSFKDGDKITIGEGVAYDSNITVTLKATGEGEAFKQTYTFVKKNPKKERVIVHFKRDAWTNKSTAPYIYAYTNDSAEKSITGSWPGTKMTSESNGWYSYTNLNIADAKVIFTMGTSSTNRDPKDQEPGFIVSDEMWYLDGKWYTSNPEVTEGTEGTVTVKYVNEAGEGIADSMILKGKVGTAYISESKSINKYELVEKPSNAAGNYTEKNIIVTYVYKQKEVNTLTVHYYNKNNWSNVYIYSYVKVDGKTTEFTGKWPGSKMTNDGNGWWSIEVSEAESATIIINNNSGSQEPSGVGTPGYEAQGEVWIKDKTVLDKDPEAGIVKVKYVDKTGNEIYNSKSTSGKIGSEYITTALKAIGDYVLVETPLNATGKYTSQDITVTYVYELKKVDKEFVINSFKSDKVSPQVPGSKITLTVDADGEETLQYKFLIKDAKGNWYKLRDFGLSNKFVWTTGATGNKTLYVDVKDGNGNIKRVEMVYSVISSKAPVINSFTANKQSPQVSKTKVTLKADATGEGILQYKFLVKDTKGNWYKLRDF